ncbi:XkdX family protein [Paenibacillus sp. CR_12]
MWYPTIKRYYDNGHQAYTYENLKTFVVAKMITPEEYKQITGIKYVA